MNKDADTIMTELEAIAQSDQRAKKEDSVLSINQHARPRCGDSAIPIKIDFETAITAAGKAKDLKVEAVERCFSEAGRYGVEWRTTPQMKLRLSEQGNA